MVLEQPEPLSAYIGTDAWELHFSVSPVSSSVELIFLLSLEV